MKIVVNFNKVFKGDFDHAISLALGTCQRLKENNKKPSDNFTAVKKQIDKNIGKRKESFKVVYCVKLPKPTNVNHLITFEEDGENTKIKFEFSAFGMRYPCIESISIWLRVFGIKMSDDHEVVEYDHEKFPYPRAKWYQNAPSYFVDELKQGRYEELWEACKKMDFEMGVGFSYVHQTKSVKHKPYPVPFDIDMALSAIKKEKGEEAYQNALKAFEDIVLKNHQLQEEKKEFCHLLANILCGNSDKE